MLLKVFKFILVAFVLLFGAALVMCAYMVRMYQVITGSKQSRQFTARSPALHYIEVTKTGLTIRKK